ncbi:hypothetical protein [Bradyrhizobium sp. CCBAU 45321]|uniref:hypothetical protein n=1 Tax=Bradyrhizobium sp. CCBAU 45321 TaxID=1641878 RepID=UPI0023049FC3|nr:hypothetical protein [Bradyrhizobium sp. CCBAU 45321]
MADDSESSYDSSNCGSPERLDPEDSEKPVQPGGVTRRDVLAGGASALLIGPAQAADTPYIDVSYQDTTRRGLVIAFAQKPTRGVVPPDDRKEWRLQASTFTDPDLPFGAGRFVLRRLAGGWRAEIAQCELPGNYQFGLRIDVKWNPTAKPAIKPSLSFTLFRPRSTIRLDVDDLIAFLESVPGKSAVKDEIIGRIDGGPLSTLVQSLFGDSFDTTSARDVYLAFHRGGYWILRAGQKVNPQDTDPSKDADLPIARRNRFAALRTEGAPLLFKDIAFAVFSGSTGGKDLSPAFVLDPKEGQEREDVRALFSGDGAPPAPESIESVSAEPRRPIPDPKPARVLYALVRRAPDDKVNSAPEPWIGAIRMGGGPGGEVATIDLQGETGRCYLGWRNANDGNPVAALRMPMALTIVRAPRTTPTKFEKLIGQLWRARDDDRAVRVVGSLTPGQQTTIETRFGPLHVAPLPKLPPRPGVSGRVPPIRIGGTGERENRTLNHFAAPLALERAAISVGSERLARAADASGLLKTPAERAAIPFSQLTFHEAECLFRVAEVPLQHTWSGRPPPLNDPPQAEAIVHIGAINKVSLPARFSLSRATLVLRRSSDLLALTYRFQDLLLEYSGLGWRVTPDRRIAAFVPSGEPLPEPTAPLICKDEPPAENDPKRYQRRDDPRPLLVVEFPPQHVAERAFLRQLRAEPKLPVPPPGTSPDRAETDILWNGVPAQRITTRNAVKVRQEAELAKLPANDPYAKSYREFRDQFGAKVKEANASGARIPEDQEIYVGPAFLDLEAARVARAFQRKTEEGDNQKADTPARRAALLHDLPEVQLSADVTAELRKKYKIADTIREDYPEPIVNSPPETTDLTNYLKEREELRERLDATYAAFRAEYDKDATVPKPFRGRASMIAQVEKQGDPKAAALAIAAVIARFDAKNATLPGEEFAIPAEARISGASRLVFRIPADDFQGGHPDKPNDVPAGSIPFTIEALTNWGAYDLAVVRRAEKVFEPLAGSDKQTANGRLPPRWARQETRDEAAKLLHQGISRGDSWSIRRDEQRALKDVPGCPTPLFDPLDMNEGLGTVTATQRMVEVAASARAPGLYETSIELPMRLMLSPAQDASWRTPLPLPDGIIPPSSALPIPLWFAQLDEAPGSSGVRAVWSPDFRSEALLDPSLTGPPHGPWAPWALPRNITARTVLDSDPKKQPERFRTGLDSSDRHELVALSSLHGLPVRGRRAANGAILGGSQFNPPSGFKLRFAGTEVLDPSQAGAKAEDTSAIYRPQPLGVNELTLTALGGSFDADTNFVPPASAKIVPALSWSPANARKGEAQEGAALFDAFSIERWRQETRLGRDIRVEVVYKGFLFPLGHRASLVKLTERRFVPGPGGVDGGPIAFLVQRFFLRVGTPLKTFPAMGQPNGGRAWPTERVEILTRVTPDILDPSDQSDPTNDEARSGRILLSDANNVLLPGLVFWPRVRPRNGGEVNFELQIDGRGERTRLPLIFVDNTAANNKDTISALVNFYNAKMQDKDARRNLQLGGGKRRYAPEKEPDGTSFETERWLLGAEGRESEIPKIVNDDRQITFKNENFDFGALLQGTDQPPFYPVMQRGTVRIAQVDRLVGRPYASATSNGTITVFFDDEYRAFGFPKDEDFADAPNWPAQVRKAKTDIFLDFVEPVPLDPGRSGERTGGPVRPTTALNGMSRSRGPIGHHPRTKQLALVGSKPVSTGFENANPTDFFGDATLLGIVDLKEALKFLLQGVGGKPEFTEITQYTSALLSDLDKAADPGVAAAKVRDRLLIPLRDALRSLAREFYDNSTPSTPSNPRAPFDELRTLLRIERLYPDVGKAYRELMDALDAAIDASATVRSTADLLAHFAVIYGAGRRFLAAVERVANDPISPVRAALRDAFNSSLADLITAAGTVLGTVKGDVLNELQVLNTKLRAKVNALLTDAKFTAWRHLAFSLPGTHTLIGISDPQKAEIEKFFLDTLTEALSKSEFIEVLVQRGPKVAAGGLETEFERAFAARIKQTTGPITTLLQNAYDAWLLAADDAVDRIVGFAYDRTFDVLQRLLIQAANIASTVQADRTIGTLLGALQNATNAAFETIGAIQTLGLDAVSKLCGGLAGAFAALAADIMPTSTAVIDNALTQVQSAFDAAKPALQALGLDGEAQQVFGELKTDLDSMSKVINVLVKAGAQIRNLKRDVCEATPDRSPVDAVMALGATRKALLTAVKDFDIRLAPAVDPPRLRTLLNKIVGASPEAQAARRAILDIARASATQAAAVAVLVKQVTSLNKAGVDGALKQTKAAVVTLRDTFPNNSAPWKALNDIVTSIDGATATARAFEAQVDTLIQTVLDRVNDAIPDLKDAAKCDQYLVALLTAVQAIPGKVDDIKAQLVDAFEARLLQTITSFVIEGAPYIEYAFTIIRDILAKLFAFFDSTQNSLVGLRKTVSDSLGGTGTGNKQGDTIGDDLSAITLDKVIKLLVVSYQAPRTGLPILSNPVERDKDYLVAEAVELHALAVKLASTDPLDDITLKSLAELFGAWGQSKSSAQVLGAQIADAAAAVASGDLKRLVDLESVRRRIEEKLKELVPAKVVLSYDLQCGLKEAGPFIPGPDSQVTLTAGGTFDLLNPQEPPRFTAACTVDAFAVDLFGVVKLFFDRAQFVNESGKGTDFNVSYRDFELGPSAAFLKPLESLMNPGGSGPFVRMRSDGPGIEAGYSLDLGIISIGALAFINVSINASCVLPFDKTPALFVASIGRKDRPVLLSCAPYIGGGFLALYANAKKMVGFEASFEFGGGGAFKFGPLSGQGRITTGIYLRRLGEEGILIEGFFYAGGDAHIACFAISATLVVRITHQPGGSMQGSAVFTFSFSMGFAKLRYSVGVQRSMGQGFSGAHGAVAAFGFLDAPPAATGPRLRSDAVSQQQDWVTYQTYFAEVDGFPA